MALAAELSRPAAIDTLTGQGAATYFSPPERADPWARECLITLIDLVINHDRVLLPQPGDRRLDPDQLGRLLVAGLQRGGVATARDVTAWVTPAHALSYRPAPGGASP